ncbi:hypothetical protein PM085_15780 [Halorubrum ezzemoulense]|uniref:Disulfide bond formation protein B n=1 Tax=Halorubrum ezzemoulense TaxID=337243 RepID=A0ABT4Z6B2_HALEZ|nr:hypothetical protein [Halorubrum ezzemoulense]MDB2293717.1 hypothetical protein [Halorubrum ezzemoulense]
MSNRARLDGGTNIYWVLPVAVVASVLVLNRVYDAEELTIKPTPEAACWLCHVSWGEVLPTLGAVTALVVVSAVVARSGVAPTVFRGGDDE